MSSPLMFEAPPGVSTCLKLGMDKNDLFFKDDSTWKFFASTYEGQKHIKSNEYEIAVSSSLLGLIEASCTNAWRDYHPYRWVEWFQALPHRVVHWSNQSHRGMDCSFCYVYSLPVPRVVQILLFFC